MSCVYEEVPGDPAIVICQTHGPDYGLYGDELCPQDADGSARAKAGI